MNATAARRPRATTLPVDLAPFTAQLTAARAVLARMGAGAVDGETRASRRDALSEAREDARQVESAARKLGAASLRTEARKLGDEFFEAQRAVDPAELVVPARPRPAWHTVVLTALFAFRNLLTRQPDLWGAKDPDSAPFHALGVTLNHWITAWLNFDDYRAAGIPARFTPLLDLKYAMFYFAPTTPRPATPAQLEQWAADDEANNTPERHAARARQHLNGVWISLAELGAPFARDGYNVRSKDPLGDAAGDLARAAEEIAAIGESVDVQELLIVRARLAGLLAAAGAAS